MANGVDPSLAERLEKCYTGIIYDVLRGRGHGRCVLTDIRPLDVSYKLAGRVYTVGGRLERGLDAHETLLAWTSLLSKAPADHVLICQPNDSTLAHMGELSSEALQFRGVRGYIVDGGCRDTEFITRIGFRVFCRYFTPCDVVGRWIADNFGEPIVISGVTVRTGDYVAADRDGVVIIPGEMAEEVVGEAERMMQQENLVRKAILEGVDPREAYLKYGKF